MQIIYLKLLFQAHLSTPCFHSYISPSSKITRNKLPAVKIIYGKKIAIFILIINGNNSTISTSNTKNSTAIKKNRDENGNRVTPKGSNPHSKGVSFSRFFNLFFEKTKDKIIKITEINISKNPNIVNKYIIYPLKDLLVGSQIYFL